MFARRSVAVLVTILMFATHSSAFLINIHKDITETALGNLDFIWLLSKPPQVRTALNGRLFSPEALKEIESANVSRDTGDCSNVKNSTVDTIPAAPCGITDLFGNLDPNLGKLDDNSWLLGQLLAGGLVATHANAEDHFDDELFAKGNAQIIGARDTILTYLKSGNFVGARKHLGYALHALQDFYSHSNWIELGVKSPYEVRLGNPALGPNAFSTFGPDLPRVARSDEPTCYTGTLTEGATNLITDPPQSIKDADEFQNSPAMQASFRDRPLTSGFFPNSNPDIEPHHKCAHGDPKPFTWRGINKDMPYGQSGIRETRHNQAVGAATLHTRIFVEEILNYGCGSDVNCLLGFMGWPTSATPTPAPAANYPPPTPITTTEFTLDPMAHSCPNPPTPHNHQPGWIDVNAKAWNYTGLTVKKGETYRFVVQRGIVLWRQGPLGTSGAPPEGDSTVNPGNTLLWITPPVPNAPIGTLVGAIWAANGNLPPKASDPTASVFPIGGGRTFTMDADGWLFLGINDGSFFNNAGCFQARVTRVP